LISGLDPASYSEPMTRFDALYFTMTAFATWVSHAIPRT
jgi:hypothetical protein